MVQLYPLNKKTVIATKNYVAIFLVIIISLLTTNITVAQNNSFKFDGLNDYIQLPIILTGDYTKELWVKADAITGTPQNLLTGDGTAIYIDDLGRIGGGNLTELLDPTPIVAGQWYHLAVTFNQTTGALNLYKDGVLVDSKVNAGGYYEPFLQIGAYNGAYNFGGSIDEVRIFNVERSAIDIASDYNCEISHRAPGLVAYYTFNRGIPGGNNASITNLKDFANNCVPYNGVFNNITLNGATSNFTADVPASFTGVCVAEPIIRVVGVSSLCIDNGDVTPSSSDGTDFGIAVESSSTNTFIIRNTGTATLTVASITSSSIINFTPNFTLPISIAPGTSYNFTITFNQSAIPGVKTSKITIFNNDNTTYTFDVSGTSALKGQTLSFDGLYSLVQTPVTLNGSYTKEAWINLAEIPAVAGNLITGTTSALYVDNAGNLGGGNLTEVSDPTGPIIIGTWTHVAIVYDAVANTVTLYKNGVAVSTNTSSAFTTDSPQQLGAFTAGFFFKGLMDEVRIWSVARTSTEILSSLNCRIPDDADGLVAYYDFNQGVAGLTNTNETTLIDRTCSHNDGTLINFALTGTDANWLSPGAPVALSCEGNVPNIRVTGLDKCIAIDGVPSLSDGTDFGLYSTPGVDHFFTILNTGTSALNITGISISGSGAAGFSILAGGATTVQPGDSVRIKIRFVHTVNETITATLTITNNDPNEGTYNIRLQGTGLGVVPVSLISFTGSLDQKVVNLKWNTSTEINNSGFDILRSNESSDSWVKIGNVAASNSVNGSMYKFTDLAPMEGVNTYRLKQIDNDGTFKFSNVVAINNLTKSIIVKSYPNPFVDRVNLVFNDKSLLNTKARVSSITGVKIADIILSGYNQSIDLSKFSKGIYILTLSNGQSLKLIKN